MKLTINEIADMANVAKSTVSKALNSQKGVSEENRKRILSIVQKMNFQPNASAKALAQCKTGIIGFVLPHEASYSLAGDYWTGIITAIADEVSQKGNNLMVITPSGKRDSPFASLETIIRRRTVDGLIIGAEQLDTKSMMSIMMEGIPFVFIGRNSEIEHYSVDVDNINGAELVVTELVNKGYKNIACITGPVEYLYTRNRIEGFTKAMIKAKLDTRQIINSEYSTENTKENIKLLLKEFPKIDALFIAAGGDFVLTILETLRKSKIDIHKFGLGVFDDSRVFDFLDCHIIAAKQPIEEIGRKSAQMIFDLIDEKTPTEKVHFLPVEIVVR